MRFKKHRKSIALILILIPIFITFRKILRKQRQQISFSITATNEIIGEFTMQTLDSDGWIINQSILQYATILSKRNDHQIEIEAMLWLDSTAKRGSVVKQNYLKCFVVLNEDTAESVMIDVFELTARQHNIYFGKRRSVHFAKCLINVEQYKRVVDNRVIVSVIDIREYKNGDAVLFGKQPLFFDRNQPREKSVLICACAMPNLKDDTFEHTVTWAKINRLINARSQVYSSDVNNPNIKRLMQEHSDLLDVFDYDLDLAVLCNRHMPGARLAECVKMHRSLFDKSRFAHFHPFHEVLMMDACFLRSKYKYKFMSNIDIDEIIVPRFFAIDNFKKETYNFDFKAPCKSYLDMFSSKIRDFKYDLYSYMLKIESIYKRNALVSEYEFQNYAFIPDISERMDQVLRLKHPNMLNYKPENLNIQTPFRDREDRAFLALMQRTRELTRCVAESSRLKFIAKSKSFKFVNFMGKRMSFNHKTVFVTDMCELIEHHSAMYKVPGAVQRKVSVEHGVLSHFRDYNYNYTAPEQLNKWLSETVQEYVIDLEMMYLLANNVEAVRS